jgi:hypothetical protein
MKLHTALYKAARFANNADAVAHPRRLPRRVRNVVVGRLLGRLGVWGRLWR